MTEIPSPQPALARPFFAYDPENGVEWFETMQEAQAYAAESLREYRRSASFDGEWSGDVEAVKVGHVTHFVAEHGDEASGYDYCMVSAIPSPEGAPALTDEWIESSFTDEEKSYACEVEPTMSVVPFMAAVRVVRAAYARAALAAQPQSTRSQRLADAGYTRRPSWKSLPGAMDGDEDAQAPAEGDALPAFYAWKKAQDDGYTDFQAWKAGAAHARAQLAQPQPKGMPTLDAIYAAWHAIGADVAGLEWAKFAALLTGTQSPAVKAEMEKHVCPFCESEWVDMDQHDRNLARAVARDTALEEAAALCELWNTASGRTLAIEIRTMKSAASKPPVQGSQA